MLKSLNERRSVKAALLNEPAPTENELVEILQTGMSAPDHGAVRPWRFTVIRDEERHQLSEIFAASLLEDTPEADQEMIDKIKSKPLRSPLIVVIWAEIMENHPKVPAAEQIVATACAAENILLAAEAKGFGAVLLTGWPAFHPTVKKSLGMADKDQIISFMYMGTPSETPRAMNRPNVADYIRKLP